MNTYLMSIEHFFRGIEKFEVNASSKADAISVAKLYVNRNPHFSGGNYRKDSIKVIKKLNKKKKG